MKKERLLKTFNYIDEKYVKEAEPKMKKYKERSIGSMLGRVACFAIVIALSLYLFIPFSTKGPDLTAYQGSEYFPIIERISDYRYHPNPYKNNFQYLRAGIKNLFGGFLKGGAGAAPGAPGNMGSDMDASPEGNLNGSYVESTDNQVGGVIEADLVKRTDKYIFRLNETQLLIYSIEKENSNLVASFDIPGFEDERGGRYHEREMYLSNDCRTITIISPYYDANYDSRIRIISIDVNDFNNIKMTKSISVDGAYNSSRMVDGKLLLITSYVVKSGNIDYNKPETYVPSITEDGESSCIKFEDIIYPEEIGSTRYSVVALIDEGSLELLGANALLDFHNDIYVSENNVYVTKEYSKTETVGDDGGRWNITMSDIAVLKYSGCTLEKLGVLTVEGVVNDQYSMDEYEGHFRAVTTTTEQTYSAGNSNESSSSSLISGRRITSASLMVFDLQTMGKIAEVRHFAPEGETVSSARFDGDHAYVCTAVIVTFSDPVFYFDLSDYTNITYTDTGVINGFSSSLIQLGDGFLLGIGEENWEYGKVEVYEERGGAVESVDKYMFIGDFSRDYKSYYVNREDDLFGFAVTYMYDEQTDKWKDVYVLLRFNGYELVEVLCLEMHIDDPGRIRAFTDDGYIYITSDLDLIVKKIF